MKYKWLLFDADNTLLDFTKASKESLFRSCDDYGIHCDEEIYKTYKTVNKKVWDLFEEKEISALELRSKRFQDFFDVMGIKGVDAFEFNAYYLQNLIQVSEVYEGAIDLLESLRPKFKMSIITNGLKEVQRPRINKLQMGHLFDSIVVSDEIGVAKPDISYFEITYNSIPTPPKKSEILVVGDNLRSDILGGNNFGVDTCWINHGNNNEGEISPSFSINSVFDIHSIL